MIYKLKEIERKIKQIKAAGYNFVEITELQRDTDHPELPGCLCFTAIAGISKPASDQVEIDFEEVNEVLPPLLSTRQYQIL